MTKPNVLCDCAGMSNERWLECRAHGPDGSIPYTVGGSDVAAIFGLSQHTGTQKRAATQSPTTQTSTSTRSFHTLSPT